MKKSIKFLSVVMVLVTLFSVFTIGAGAITTSSTAKEMLTYYESCVKKTSKNNYVVKANNKFSSTDKYDLSALSETDRKETLEMYYMESETVSYNGEMVEYLHGDSAKDFFVYEMSEIMFYFSISRRIKEFNYKLKSSKLTTASNGDQTIVFNCTLDAEKVTFTVKLSKSGTLKSFTYKSTESTELYSANDVLFPASYAFTDTYTLVYKKVDATGISLSENEVTLGYKDSYVIQATVTPSNATYNGIYVLSDDEYFDVVYYEVNDDGTIVLEDVNRGTAVLDVYTYDGDFLASCTVTVKYSFFEIIIKFFTDLFSGLMW